MFITVCSFRARPGEEDAVVALHEDWDRSLRWRSHGFVSGELLATRETPARFIRIERFQDEESARQTEFDPEHTAWSRRLSSLAVDRIERRSFHVAWTFQSARPVASTGTEIVGEALAPVPPSAVTRRRGPREPATTGGSVSPSADAVGRAAGAEGEKER